jgi:DNA-binding MarR family transcriptional regulator
MSNGSADDRKKQKRQAPDVLVPDEVMEFYFAGSGERKKLTEIVQLMYVLRSTAQRANEATSARLAKYDLSATTFNVLVFLGASAGESMPLATLGEHLHTRATNVTAIVDSLERRGFVRRVPNPDDRRSTLAVLTARGRTTLRKAMPVQHGLLEEVFAATTAAERKALTALLVRINRSLLAVPDKQKERPS